MTSIELTQRISQPSTPSTSQGSLSPFNPYTYLSNIKATHQDVSQFIKENAHTMVTPAPAEPRSEEIRIEGYANTARTALTTMFVGGILGFFGTIAYGAGEENSISNSELALGTCGLGLTFSLASCALGVLHTQIAIHQDNLSVAQENAASRDDQAVESACSSAPDVVLVINPESSEAENSKEIMRGFKLGLKA